MAKISNAGQGSGVTYTVDPTVNGPWTHTRPDIPLFKTGAAGGTTPAAGTGGKGPNGNGLTGRAALGHISNQQKAQMQAGFDRWMKGGLGGGGFRGVFGGMPTEVRGSGMALGGAGRGNGNPVAPPIAPRPHPPSTGGPGPVYPGGGGAIGTPVNPGTPSGPTDPNNPEPPGSYGMNSRQVPPSIFQPPGAANLPGVSDPRTPISRRNRDAIAVALAGGTLNSNPRRGL